MKKKKRIIINSIYLVAKLKQIKIKRSKTKNKRQKNHYWKGKNPQNKYQRKYKIS